MLILNLTPENRFLHSRINVIGNSNKKHQVSSFDPPPANNLSLCLAMRSTAT